MNLRLDKKSILKKTVQFGGITLLSRILGIIRDLLNVRFLGVGVISDAFITAFKIPHFLRRIFAEGALSVSFIPVFVKKIKNKELNNSNGLMSISFLFFEGIVFFLCLFVSLYPNLILKIIAPGFSAEQIGYAIPFLRILFPILFFISSSALFAGALNSINHFFIPAFGPVLLNIVYISTLLFCLKYNFSVSFLCYGILFGGFLQFLMHLVTYLMYGFRFGRINSKAMDAFKLILKKFLPSLLGVSIIEINLFIDTSLASFLSQGSVSLLYYCGRFMNIPIGIFAVGFATVLLPQFSRFAIYAPKRLNFYVLEVTKFVSFIIIPAMLVLIFISEPIFSVIMLGKKATLHDVWLAKWILIVYSTGLVFYCLNKILVNVFYALHDTKTPTIALAISTIVNFVCNVIGMIFWGAFGIAGSTVISSIVLSILLFIFLQTKHDLKFYLLNYFKFFIRYMIQILIASLFFFFFYHSFFYYLHNTSWYLFFYESWGYLLFVLFLASLTCLFIFLSRNLFGIKLYFLSK